MSQGLKNFTLMRDYKSEATPGIIIDPSTGEKVVATLEPPKRNNAKDDPKTSINESGCIPEGKYTCKRRDPQLFKNAKFKDNWEILNVPNKGGICFHSGNYWFESKSCVLVGSIIQDMNPLNKKDFDGDKRWYASQSKDALKKFSEKMPIEFILDIISIDTLCDARNL